MTDENPEWPGLLRSSLPHLLKRPYQAVIKSINYQLPPVESEFKGVKDPEPESLKPPPDRVHRAIDPRHWTV